MAKHLKNKGTPDTFSLLTEFVIRNRNSPRIFMPGITFQAESGDSSDESIASAGCKTFKR